MTLWRNVTCPSVCVCARTIKLLIDSFPIVAHFCLFLFRASSFSSRLGFGVATDEQIMRSKYWKQQVNYLPLSQKLLEGICNRFQTFPLCWWYFKIHFSSQRFCKIHPFVGNVSLLPGIKYCLDLQTAHRMHWSFVVRSLDDSMINNGQEWTYFQFTCPWLVLSLSVLQRFLLVAASNASKLCIQYL